MDWYKCKILFKKKTKFVVLSLHDIIKKRIKIIERTNLNYFFNNQIDNNCERILIL